MIDSKIGEVRKNNKGTCMKIIAYRKHSDIDVEFLDEHHYVKQHSTYTNFMKGEIKNPFDKITFGVGYLGTDEGIWNVNTPKVQYNTWKDMIERCCVENTKDKFSHYYDDVNCCKEWLCYKNFDEYGAKDSHWETDQYPVGKVDPIMYIFIYVTTKISIIKDLLMLDILSHNRNRITVII